MFRWQKCARSSISPSPSSARCSTASQLSGCVPPVGRGRKTTEKAGSVALLSPSPVQLPAVPHRGPGLQPRPRRVRSALPRRVLSAIIDRVGLAAIMQRAPRRRSRAASIGLMKPVHGRGGRWHQHQAAPSCKGPSSVPLVVARERGLQHRGAEGRRNGGDERIGNRRGSRFRASGRVVRRLRPQRSNECEGASLCQEGAGCSEGLASKASPPIRRAHRRPSAEWDHLGST
jgi:hypothetical protein